MDWLKTILEASPLTALFLVIAVGYVAGEINVKGFALGSGAVLFVGLACGAFAPKAGPPGLLGTLGLLMFLYCVGIHYGHEWLRGLTSRDGIKANVAGVCGLAVAGAVTLAIYQSGRVRLPETLGLFAGATTNTPTLQAILDLLGTQDAAVGYSVAYPFGVAGPILCMYLFLAILKPVIAEPANRRILPGEVRLRNPALAGLSIADLQQRLPDGVQIAAIRRGRHNRVPSASTTLDEGDVLLTVGTDAAAIARAHDLIGETSSGALAGDRSELDYILVYASKASIVSTPLGMVTLPGGFDYRFAHVRRGDVDLLPDENLVLEFGDRVGVLCDRAHFQSVRSFFGDSIKGASDFSYISLGVGAALGLMVGMIPIPVPGVGRITLGLAGVLLVALVLGARRRTGGIVWTLPLSANLVLRNFGLTVFLAQVGIASGEKFATTVMATGASLLLLGAIIVLALVTVTLVVGRLLAVPADDLLGVVSGVTGNPAILAYANRATPTERPDIGFATVFPSMTILKILFAQIAVAVLGT